MHQISVLDSSASLRSTKGGAKSTLSFPSMSRNLAMARIVREILPFRNLEQKRQKFIVKWQSDHVGPCVVSIVVLTE